MIHFGAEEVVWECKSDVVRESGECCLEPLPTTGADNPSSVWKNYVEVYSLLQLTFEKDKLVALSGMAERVAKLWPDDRYIAGLWEKTLLLDLAWRTFIGPDIVARPSSFRAPTWSWASIKSAVHWDIGNYSESRGVLKGAEVVDVWCPATYTGNVFSEDDDENLGLRPTITIRGPMMAARLSPGTIQKSSHRGPRAEDHEREYSREVKFAREHTAGFEWIQITLRLDYLFHKPGRYYVGPDSELFVLPSTVERSRSEALLLRKREGTPFYERLGLVSFSGESYYFEDNPRSLRTHFYSLPLFDITII